MNRKSDSFSGPRLGGWYCCTCEWRVDTYKPQPPRPRVPPRYTYIFPGLQYVAMITSSCWYNGPSMSSTALCCVKPHNSSKCARGPAGQLANVLRTAHVLALRKIVVFQIVINGADCSARHTYVQLITKCDAGVPLVKNKCDAGQPPGKANNVPLLQFLTRNCQHADSNNCFMRCARSCTVLESQ